MRRWCGLTEDQFKNLLRKRNIWLFWRSIGARHQNERLNLVFTFSIAYCSFLKCRIRGPAVERWNQPQDCRLLGALQLFYNVFSVLISYPVWPWVPDSPSESESRTQTICNLSALLLARPCFFIQGENMKNVLFAAFLECTSNDFCLAFTWHYSR